MEALTNHLGKPASHTSIVAESAQLAKKEEALVATLREVEPELLLRVASRYLANGDFEQAERVIERALSDKVEQAGFFHLMSVVKERKGDLESAIVYARESLRIEPDDYNRIERYGQMLTAVNRFADAGSAFSRLIAIRPKVLRYHRLLANAYVKQNRYDDAINALSTALSRYPDFSELTIDIGELNLKRNAFANISHLIQCVDSTTLELLPLNWGHLMFSQFGEDGILWQLFRTVRNGFYVDVGAHHPISMSNTALLHHYNGWSGINIDADQRYVDEFNKWRAGDINICCGVGLSAGEAKMAIFADGAVNSFDANQIEMAQTKGGRKILEFRDINIRTLEDILESYLPLGRQIDLLNIDAEGWDTSILRSNNWSKYRPSLILVEDHSMTLNNVDRSETYKLLIKEGYSLFSQAWATSFYRLAS